MSIRWAARCIGLGGLAFCALQIAAGQSTTGADVRADAGPDTLAAIWRTQAVEFRYRSERQHYSCEEFATRLDRIIASMGGRLDAQTELHCAAAFSSSITGRIVVTAPVEATEQNINQARAGITPKDRLIARVNGRPDPATHIRPFPAQWRAVSTTRPRLDAADCELLRAVKQQILPALSVRDPKIPASCGLRQPPSFSVVALIPVDEDATRQNVRPAGLATEDCAHRDAKHLRCRAPIENTDAEVSPAG